MNKKYITRRILDSHSEEVFAKKLIKKGQSSYFPFKDIGVDVIGIDKKNNPYFYQLKARNANLASEQYWFMVNIKKLEKFPNTKRSFWVFCCFKQDNAFDFFIVPFHITKKWFNLYHNSEGIKRKHEQYPLKIVPLSKGTYGIAPKWINKRIDIMKYLMK